MPDAAKNKTSRLVCRSCGSTEEKRQEALERGAVNCCPERAMNEVIEEDRGVHAMTEPCMHPEFESVVEVARLHKLDVAKITGYSATVKIRCAACGLQFRFLGNAFGYSVHEPRLSADATELRAPIEPAVVPEILGQPVVSGNA